MECQSINKSQQLIISRRLNPLGAFDFVLNGTIVDGDLTQINWLIDA